jgi:AcrR family transcriptional regulator
MTPAPSLNELITSVQHDSPTDDPLDLLATASTTVTDLSTLGDAVLDHFVAGARRQGRSWSQISSVLGVSKQAAHKRFSPLAQLFSTAGTRNFERFTDRARQTVAAAVDAAKALGHGYIGTEHLLLGQFREPGAVAAKVLLAHGITEEVVRGKIVAVTPAGTPITDDSRPPFTPRAADAFGHALTEALNLGHNYIGTEHLLLGLYGDDQGLAARILTELGLTAEQVREDVIRALAAIVAAMKTD